jgi:CDGSH-type Zn-finger protein
MEFCAICERHIDWDGHTESAHLKDEVERLRGDYETSHASRVHADTAVLRLEAEVERLRTLTCRCGDSQKEMVCVDCHMTDMVGVESEVERLRARTNAALGLYETAMEIPPLAEQMVKALRGEK